MRELRPSLRRALAALLLGLFASAWMLDAHHRAAVRHVRCEVDGALAHGDHRHADQEAEHAEHRADDGPRLAAGEAPEGDHDHCGLPDLGRTSGLDPPVAPLGAPALAAVPLDRVHPAAPSHEAVARLFLAPKQSPPRG